MTVHRRASGSRGPTRLLLVFATGIFMSGPLYGQDTPACESPVLTLEEAADLVRVEPEVLEGLSAAGEVPSRRVGTTWRFACAALLAWLGDSESLQPARVLTAQELDMTRAAGRASAALQEEPIGEAPEEREAEDVFLRGQRVLLAPGEVVMDFGQFYLRSDVRELAQIGEATGLATVEQRVFTTIFVGRVGVADETEVFASTSFSSQHTGQFLGSTRLAESSTNEFGGLRIGARRTLLREGTGRPDVILTFDGLLPTGDRIADIGGGLVLVKSVDPVVLFAAGSYHRPFTRGLTDTTRIVPGGRVDASMGYGLALNDTLALSMSVSAVFAEEATLDGAAIRQPDSYGAGFGLTSWLAEGLYIEPSVSFGLNGPGRSVAFGLTLPYAF